MLYKVFFSSWMALKAVQGHLPVLDGSPGCTETLSRPGGLHRVFVPSLRTLMAVQGLFPVLEGSPGCKLT
jgi:hypothetical protein